MRFLGISVCVLLCAMLIKDKHRAFAVVLSVSGVCLVLLSVVSQLGEIAGKIQAITDAVPSVQGYLKLMLKVLAITLMTQAVSDICRDNGESALAGVTETAAKAVVIALVLPLFETVITIVSGLIK